MADNQQRSMEQMQRDAERRMRDMQARSNRAIHGNDMPPVPNFVRMNNRPNRQQSNMSSKQPQQAEHGQPEKPMPPEPPKHDPPPRSGGILSSLKGLDILKIFNFQNLHIDGDVLIIIALIFLLSTEETDELLLLALVYIML